MLNVLLCSHYEGFRPFDEGQRLYTDDFLEPHRSLKKHLKSVGYHLENIEDNEKNLEEANAILYFDLPVKGYRKCLTLRTQVRVWRETLRFLLNLKPDHFERSFSVPKNSPKRILLMWESKAITPEHYLPENHKWFDIILTQDDSLVDNKRYFKIFNPIFVGPPPENIASFTERNFAVMVNANKVSRVDGELYSERRKTADYFAKTAPRELDIFGKMWGEHPCAKGAVHDKIKTMSGYKFAICYENFSTGMGYITEKIFDCFKSRTVPIYWGAPNIADYVPTNTFIDRSKFQSNEQLYAYLKAMTSEQFNNYLVAIEEFLKPANFENFSVGRYCQTIEKALTGGAKSAEI